MSMTNNRGKVPPLKKTPMSNPIHEFLFSIPKPSPSTDPISLPSKPIPQKQQVTGDHELDTVLWLSEVCSTTCDLDVLDKVLEYAQQITTPAEKLAVRYRDYQLENGVTAFAASMTTFGFGDIDRVVRSARYRINKTIEGLQLFGSFEGAMAPTAPERMLMDSITLSEDEFFSLSYEEIPNIFGGSANPGTLSEALQEIRYWEWLDKIRKSMIMTFDPNYCDSYRDSLLGGRKTFVFRQLLVLDPVDLEEARKVARAIQPDDLRFDTDFENKILLHLLGVHPT
jgi:hypothetical protein